MEKERNNPFYLEGLRMGTRHGKIPSLQKMILSDTFEEASEKEMQMAILNAYSEVDESIPVKWLEEEQELTKKEWRFWLLGYTEGHQKNVANRATEKYHGKVGLKSKSYKLHEYVIDAFAEACDKKGVSYASALEKLMIQFVDEVNAED